MTNIPTLLPVDLTLLDKENCIKRETDWLEGYQAAACGGVTHILLGLPSCAEAPDALSHDITRLTLTACDECGLKVVWGRDLWERWPGRSVRPQKSGDVFDYGYYAAYLRGLAAEAAAIGAEDTWAQCEPYGESIFHDTWFKKTGLTVEARAQMIYAIGLAREIAPPTTYAYPAGGHDPIHYAYALRFLGLENLFNKTYYLRSADEKVNANPPFPNKLGLHYWGSAIKPSGSATGLLRAMGLGQLTVAEFRALDFAAIQKKHPECKGFMVYADPGKVLQVMQQLGEAP